MWRNEAFRELDWPSATNTCSCKKRHRRVRHTRARVRTLPLLEAQPWDAASLSRVMRSLLDPPVHRNRYVWGHTLLVRTMLKREWRSSITASQPQHAFGLGVGANYGVFKSWKHSKLERHPFILYLLKLLFLTCAEMQTSLIPGKMFQCKKRSQTSSLS